MRTLCPQSIPNCKKNLILFSVYYIHTPRLAKGATLADLYDPLYMPGDLLKAHQALDLAVDRCYRPEAFGSERARVEYLFGEYEKLVAPLGSC